MEEVGDKEERRDFPYQRHFIGTAFLPRSTFPRNQLRKIMQEPQHQPTP